MRIVNMGCGASPTAGAENYDNSFTVRLGRRPLLKKLLRALSLISAEQAAYADFCRENGVMRGSCTRMPIADGSVDVLYASHMLEHLSMARRAAFFGEAKRVLKPGGVLRLSVPDMARLVKKYEADGDCDALVEATLLYPAADDTLRDRLKQLLFGHRGHHWMYDAASLRKLLTESGFQDVSFPTAGNTTIPFETGIDLSERADESVYAECRKGGQ